MKWLLRLIGSMGMGIFLFANSLFYKRWDVHLPVPNIPPPPKDTATANEAPTAHAHMDATIEKDQPIGTIIGTLRAVLPKNLCVHPRVQELEQELDKLYATLDGYGIASDFRAFEEKERMLTCEMVDIFMAQADANFLRSGSNT